MAEQWALVCTDLDGTLLTSAGDISPMTLDAIRMLQEWDMLFVVASARNPLAIRPVVDQYDLHCPIIAYGGALILGEDRRVSWHRGIEKREAADILTFAGSEASDLLWGIYTPDAWTVYNENPGCSQPPLDGVLLHLRGDTVSKILGSGAPKAVERTYLRLREVYPGCTVRKAADGLVEIFAGGVGKAQALQALCKSRKVPLAEAIAFGDDAADMEMLKAAGAGFLMGNAPPELQKKGLPVTADNDHDGIVQGLAEIGLMKKGPKIGQ